MKIINQSHKIISLPNDVLETIEIVGRTCYKSENKITTNSSSKFTQMLINRGHHAMIEFGDIIVKFITNRGVTHELVRHRLCSFGQESTRYVNYKKGVEFIKPVWGNFTDEINTTPQIESPELEWIHAMESAERHYINLINKGWRPEQAREVLPNSLKTEIVVKANIREWRHIFKLRTSKAAHPQIRKLMEPLLIKLKQQLPVVFDDLS